MNQLYDIALIISFKLILLVGFVLSVKFWLKKKNNLPPVIVYWVLGIFFVFMMSYTVLDWFFMQFYYIENHLSRNESSVGSLSGLIAITIYIFIGVKFFRRK